MGLFPFFTLFLGNNSENFKKLSGEASKKIVISWGVLFCDFVWVNLQNNPEMISSKEIIEYKEGAIEFPYTLLWRFWTAEELVSA